MKVQPFVFVVAMLQLLAGAYSTWRGDWQMALSNFFLGFANVVFSTMGR
jgi:hypothetical protein